MAANVAVVKIVHSLVEKSIKSSIKGVLSRSLLFLLHSKSYMKTHKIQTYGNYTLWQVCKNVCWRFWKEAASQGRHSHGGIIVKLLLIPLVRGTAGTECTHVLLCGNGESDIPQSLTSTSSLPIAAICVEKFSRSASSCVQFNTESIQEAAVLTKSLFVRPD